MNFDIMKKDLYFRVVARFHEKKRRPESSSHQNKPLNAILSRKKSITIQMHECKSTTYKKKI